MHMPNLRWRRLADVPIYAKVSLAPGLILFVLLLLSLTSLQMLHANAARLRAISEQAFPTYQRAAETKDAVNAIQTALQHTLSVAANESDPERIKQVAAPVRAAITRAEATLERLRQQIGGQSDATATAGKIFAAYHAAANDVLEAVLSDPATASMMMVEADDQFARLSAELDGYKSRADSVSQSMSQDAISSAGNQRLLLLSGLGAAVMVCIAIMVATSRAIGRPVLQLTDTMTAMATDDLDRSVPALGRRDEIGAMARAVEVFRTNGLAARQIAAQREREQSEKQRRQAAIERHTNDFGLSISGVMTSLGQSAERVRQAASAMTEAATTVSHQAGTTADGAGKASLDLASVAAAIDEFTASVDEISRQVAAGAEVAREAVRCAGTGQETMRGLAAAASHIDDVVRLITGIARQTNLLALNATIEAAHAGDAGKGFAIVAHEVKTLAGRIAEATSEIDTQINEVRGATDASLSAMSEIGAIIARMDVVAGAIAAAAGRQAATTRALAVSVQAVSAATDRTAQAMEQVAGVADDAGSVSREVLGAADAIGREASNLRSEVDNFLVAVRNDGQDRRRYERMSGNGAAAVLRVAGRAAVQTVLQDLSRGGAALTCDIPLPAGTEVDVELPDTSGPVTARVVRSGGGVLAVVFHQDAAALEMIDRALDGLAGSRRAA